MDLLTCLSRNKKRKHKYTILEKIKGVYSQVSRKLDDFLKKPFIRYYTSKIEKWMKIKILLKNINYTN